jgi:hypothetical protein
LWHAGQGSARIGRIVTGLPRPVVGALLTALLLSSCAPAEVEPPPPRGPSAPTLDDDNPQLLIDFDEGFTRAGPGPAATGQQVRMVTSGAGRLTGSPDPSGGVAAQFPTVEAADEGNLAALVVSDEDRDLVPGDEKFIFGMDVMLPTQARRTEKDDGDNLMQRGLFGSGGQYKLQLDDGRPSCRAVGKLGEAFVQLREVLEPGQWYRLRCEKVQQRLSIFVAELPMSTGTEWDSASAWSLMGTVGTVAPLSVGAKVNVRGGLVLGSPDQFNGVLDNVMVQIDGLDGS